MSEHEQHPAVRRSVFFKLVAIMLTMAASLLLMVAGFFVLIVGPSMTSSTKRFVEEYARVVAASSPDLPTAQRIASRLDLQIGYEGPNSRWATADDPFLTEVQKRGGFALGVSPGLETGRTFLTQDYYVVPAPNGGKYVFASTLSRKMQEVHLKLLLLLLLLMTGVVFSAYGFQRQLLRPLRSLGAGVARLSEGELDVVVPIDSRDEFGVLTNGFNQMVGRIRAMLQARDQLLLDVSHELRSPLTRMKVALELLPEGENKKGMASDLSEMEAMISELLELERLRDGRGIRTVRQDLLPIVREVADTFREQPPGVRVVTAVGEILLDVDGDKLRTVLRNLVGNAVKYSLADSHAVEISVVENIDTVEIRVRDDGPGIPESESANLFEPFFRVDRSRSKKTGGYGLGLSICKRIMETHGGSITVENNPKRGASFIARLPMARNLLNKGGAMPRDSQPYPSHESMNNLYAKALLSLAALAVVMGLLLFVPAGTIEYWQGWVYLAIFTGASLLTTLYLVKKDPALLKRRMRGGPTAEKETTQKIIMLFASSGFIALLVVPAVDHRLGWSAVPLFVAIVGDILVAIGFYLIFLVYKENTFTSATIEVAENQKVISTGPYALVRHPMYASASLYVFGTPLALGSYWGLLAIAFMMPFLIWRLLDEEKFLAKNLSGYLEYMKKVRYRLVPSVW
jgi:signal transduction histidine kinase/protein-S-isoprenylcysteine O-methyltransferase Ste14